MAEDQDGPDPVELSNIENWRKTETKDDFILNESRELVNTQGKGSD